MTAILTKRAYDVRLFEVNLGPAMRDTDSIGEIDSITADGVTIDSIQHGAALVYFRVSGGEATRSYPVTIRFSTAGAPEQMLEALVYLQVLRE